jgi:hypothetical protein
MAGRPLRRQRLARKNSGMVSIDSIDWDKALDDGNAEADRLIDRDEAYDGCHIDSVAEAATLQVLGKKSTPDSHAKLQARLHKGEVDLNEVYDLIYAQAVKKIKTQRKKVARRNGSIDPNDCYQFVRCEPKPIGYYGRWPVPSGWPIPPGWPPPTPQPTPDFPGSSRGHVGMYPPEPWRPRPGSSMGHVGMYPEPWRPRPTGSLEDCFRLEPCYPEARRGMHGQPSRQFPTGYTGRPASDSRGARGYAARRGGGQWDQTPLADQTPLGSSFSHPSQLSVLGLTDDQRPLGSSFRQASRHAAPLVDQTRAANIIEAPRARRIRESDQTPLGIDGDQTPLGDSRIEQLDKQILELEELSRNIEDNMRSAATEEERERIKKSLLGLIADIRGMETEREYLRRMKSRFISTSSSV